MVAPKTDQTGEGKTAGQAGKGTLAPSFADVARQITGDGAPPWLEEALAQWAPSLTIDRAVALRQPGRSEMKKKLQNVQAAAALIVSALNDGATRGFLDATSPGQIPYHGQIDHILRDLARRTEEAISSLMTKDGKTKAGRNKAEPPGHISPKTFCAAIILEAWRLIHGAKPAPKNTRAAAAAELFWNASTRSISIEPAKAALERIVAKEPKSWGEPLNRWRPHFEKAEEPAAAEIRQQIRDHLANAKHSAEMLAGDKSA